jgi:PAS domain S-box-containing protein
MYLTEIEHPSTYIEINNAFEALAGAERSDAIGKSSAELGIDIDPATRERYFATLREEGRVRDFEAPTTFANGRTAWMEFSAEPIESQGQRIFVTIARDITPRKLAEEQLRKSLAEKETLLRELHHRTKNNMNVIIALLNMQAQGIDDARFTEAIADAEGRIHSMALVHEKLYEANDLSRINLKDYVHELANTMVSSYNSQPGRRHLIEELEDVSILLDTAIPCGLVLNELLSNALKHAFPGEANGTIRLGLHRAKEGTIHLEVSDDGIGLSHGFDPRKDGLMGMQTIVALAEGQLAGTINFVSGPGLSCRIAFRDIHYQPRV